MSAEERASLVRLVREGRVALADALRRVAAAERRSAQVCPHEPRRPLQVISDSQTSQNFSDLQAQAHVEIQHNRYYIIDYNSRPAANPRHLLLHSMYNTRVRHMRKD
jgi:hypothetical protein